MRISPKMIFALLLLGMTSCVCRLEFNDYELEEQDLSLIADFNANELIYSDTEGNRYFATISSRQTRTIDQDTECERNTLEAAFVDIELVELDVAFRASVLKTAEDRSYFDMIRLDNTEFFFPLNCSNTNAFNCKTDVLVDGAFFQGVFDWRGRAGNALVNRIIYKPDVGILYFAFTDGRSFQLEQQ